MRDAEDRSADVVLLHESAMGRLGFKNDERGVRFSNALKVMAEPDRSVLVPLSWGSAVLEPG